MFVVALLSALIAPWVRGWSAGQWLALATQTGLVAVVFAACLAGSAWSRRNIARQLGEAHFRVTARTWGAQAWTPASAFAMIGFATFMLLLLAASTIVTQGRIGTPYLQSVYAGVFAAMGFTQIQYPPDLMYVGERGVAVGSRFIPWDQLWCSYQPGSGRAPLFLKTAGWAFEVFADREAEEVLAHFLQQRAKAWPNPPQRSRK